MKGHRERMLIVVAALTMLCVPVQAQQSVATSSTYGEDFFIGFLPTIGGSRFATVRLTIGTSATIASFVVQSFDQVIHEGNVTSSSPVVVSIPMDLIVTGNDFSNRQKGVRVTSVKSVQLFVLAETFVNSFFHSTFLVYPDPRESLGDVDIEYEYIIVSIDDPAATTNTVFLLVGCDDNTTFTIVPSQTVELPSDLQTLSFSSISIDRDISSHQLTLHRMQTLLVSQRLDLTGTRVISNKPLVVISGHECASPSNTVGCELLAVQIPPVATWGTEFLLAPFAGRNTDHTFMIIASNDTTLSAVSCGNSSRGVQTQDLAFTLTVFENNYCHIESTGPIFVVQLAHVSAIDGRGDPAIAAVSPIDQYINSIDFFTLPTDIFPSNYISILVPAENYDPNSIVLDNTVLECEWQEIYNRSMDVVGYGCNMTIVSGSTTAVQHTINYMIPDGRLSVTAYGFNTPPTAAGYAYLTGQRLKITEVTDPSDIAFETDSLPLFDIENFPGVMELPREVDSTSDPIIIERGLIFGDVVVTTAQVNENGVISFNGQQWRFSYPEIFPTDHYSIRNGLAVAPFWSDNDIRRSGAVRYAVYSSSEGASNQQGRAILDQINARIQAQQPEGEEVFTGTWILIAHWDHVHPSPHGDDNHRGIPEEELERVCEVFTARISSSNKRTNNYQAIIVTNNIRTFVIFIYTCGEIQWSALGRNRAAVVGYNARGDYLYNHPSSGFSVIGDSVSCTFRLRRRQARQVSSPSMNITMNISGNASTVQMRAECMRKNISDNFALSGTTVQTLMSMLDPCPPDLQKVMDDFGRFIRQPGDFPSSVCYVSAKFLSMALQSNQDRISLTQQCCYTDDMNGALQTSINDMYPGTMLLYHPIYNEAAYLLRDKGLRDACCGVPGSCQDFFDRRPIISSENYSSPVVGIGWGDPHYVTFDERYFDFNDVGEFNMLEVLPADDSVMSPDPVFTIQGRTEDSDRWVGATTHGGVAFGRPGLAFHVGMSPGFRVFQTKPQLEEITSRLQNVGQSVNISSTSQSNPWPEVVLTRMNNKKVHVAFYDTGIALIVEAFERLTGYNVNFEVRVPKTFQGKTRGFLGNLDSNPTNDLFKREGMNLVQLPDEISEEDLAREFLTWGIGQSNSDRRLLHPSSSRRKRQSDQSNIIFFHELNFTAEQRVICKDTPPCLFDLVVTGEPEIAMNTLQVETEANATKESFRNSPPIILANSVLRENIGEEVFYRLSVSDPDGDNFNLTLMNELPGDTALEQVENTEEYLLKWTLLEITNATLTFVARDLKGAATIFSPSVELCACVNNGNCTRDGLLVDGPTIVMNCHCSEAFSGRFCEEDRDGCTELQCFEGVECRDVPAPGIGAVCGACPEGYTGDEVKCYDIDECSQNETNVCDQLCINTDGSFMCACEEGYELKEGTNQCQDINECDQVNDCHQLCQNTLGSFVCSCDEGFILADDGKNCTASQVCAETNICSDMCANINGEDKCFCPIGFQLLTPEGSQCIDVDECQNTTTAPCDQLCMNTMGSYECRCTSGYELQQDGQTCEDIDECLEAAINSIDICEDVENSRCVNAIGFYNCSCVSGYKMMNESCQRIEEDIPPPPPVVVPTVVIENSLNFTTSAFTPSTFTPDIQQIFREVTAIVINEYCLMINCSVISQTEATREIVNLQVDTTNVAIPISLIIQNDTQMTLTFYVQIADVFLIREDLQEAVQLGEDQYRNAGFLSTLVTATTVPPEVPTTQPSTDPPGIPFCFDCGRHVECTVEGKFQTDGNVRLMIGTQMKCSVQLETTLATTIRDQANIDGTFVDNQNFLSPGSVLFLKHLGVIVEAPENVQPCNVTSFIQHWNPGVVFQELGLVGLSFTYLKEDGVFDSLYMSTEELQTIVFNYSDIVNRLGEDLGPENACSFQSLLFYLTTGMQYLLETAVCRVFTAEDTVVNFAAYCG